MENIIPAFTTVTFVATIISLVSAFLGLTTFREERIQERLKIFRQKDYVLQRLRNNKSDSYNRVLRSAIERMLEAATRALVFPNTEESTQIIVRSFCHIVDARNGVLVPFALYSAVTPSDHSTLIPIRGVDAEYFVISEAYNSGKVICQELQQTHLQTLSAKLKQEINPQLKCVLAAPIREFNPLGDVILGTVSFDSPTHSATELAFNNEAAAQIIKNLAESIFLLFELRSEHLNRSN